jgi:hypothetical protein
MALTLNERIIASLDDLWATVMNLNPETYPPICQIIGRVLIHTTVSHAARCDFRNIFPEHSSARARTSQRSVFNSRALHIAHSLSCVQTVRGRHCYETRTRRQRRQSNVHQVAQSRIGAERRVQGAGGGRGDIGDRRGAQASRNRVVVARLVQLELDARLPRLPGGQAGANAEILALLRQESDYKIHRVSLMFILRSMQQVHRYWIEPMRLIKMLKFRYLRMTELLKKEAAEQDTTEYFKCTAASVEVCTDVYASCACLVSIALLTRTPVCVLNQYARIILSDRRTALAACRRLTWPTTLTLPPTRSNAGRARARSSPTCRRPARCQPKRYRAVCSV